MIGRWWIGMLVQELHQLSLETLLETLLEVLFRLWSASRR
jgi:hypothetical protein